MKNLTLIIMIFLSSGCGALLKTEYQRPAVVIPEHWNQRNTGTSWVAHSSHWWDTFEDPQLSRAINDVLVANNDLAAAGFRLQQARLDSQLANTNLTPEVTTSGSASNSKNTRRDTNAIENYSVSVGLSYELDLWGKLARTREQSAWLAEASALDRQNTALMLIGTTSQYYWLIGNLNQKIANNQRSLELANETESIITSRYHAGYVSKLDLLQATQSRLDQTNNLADLVQQREEARNSLAILFNRPSSVRLSERAGLDLSQTIALSPELPLTVISRRPDVQSAEWQLRAALAGSDVAKLNFYPSLSLNASLAAGSNLFTQWFTNPARTLGSTVALPFIQWNTVELTVKRSRLDVDIAAATFRDKVYAALADVEKSITQRQTSELQRQNALQSLAMSQQRLVLAKSQYLSGAVSIQSWLDAQDNLLAVENQLADIQNSYLNSTLQLWMALGGENIPEPPSA
ncbi:MULTISPECIES: efflux transporter outer membrane subunit [Rahnella]|uniref:TolC family protein n=1 Tax=Rahnella laticis TaxID=2787622 RepID=A0ABS0E505_9GAMM|nr:MULTISPECIES: TolC family protein [Rahnella]MBF7978374.1 TolC family protein [Rahnella laticis]MBF7997909.1 TolC family protein [Rahnella sp. LAC-M12]